MFNFVFRKYKTKRILSPKEHTVLGIGEGGFQTARTGSATAVLIWKNITVNCDNELGLRISFQTFAEGSLLSVKQQSSQGPITYKFISVSFNVHCNLLVP